MKRILPALIALLACTLSATAFTPQNRIGQVTRAVLTPSELGDTQPVHFALKMRNYAELEARIANHEILTTAEMQARYFPTKDSWDKVAAWATSQGLVVGKEDPSHMTVFTSATVAQAAAALQVHFVKVYGTDGNEYTASLETPVLPAEISNLVREVRKLKTHLKPRHSAFTINTSWGSSPVTCMTPQAVAANYGVSGLTGAGQTIIIVGGSAINPADLTTFWSTCGLPTTLSQFTEFDPNPPGLGANANASEETKDIEWASGIAPAAKVLYISSIDPSEILSIITSRNDPTIHQISCSWGLSEAYYSVQALPPTVPTTPQ